MTGRELFDLYFGQCPLVAIIRGVTPDDSVETARALFDSGIRIIEVPLNSPDPFTSIRRIADSLGDEALVGAGTVVELDDVARVKEAGGRIVVSPNMNPRIISATVDSGMVSSPGVFTPTEAWSAIHCGAHAIKLFPAEAASPKVVKALRSVLPKDMRLLVVGGVTPDSIGGWIDAGADGFGLGGGLYKPGQSVADTAAKARAYFDAVSRR